MTTANWITLLVTLAGLAATWGGLLVRVKVAESKVDTLDKGRERQGARIGDVEERIAMLEGASGVTRTRRSTRGIVLPEDDGS